MKLYEGGTETHIHWFKQFDYVIKGNPYDTTKNSFVIVSVMLYGYLTDTWTENASSMTEETVAKRKIDNSRVFTEVRAKRCPSSKVFKLCLVKLKDSYFRHLLPEN